MTYLTVGGLIALGLLLGGMGLTLWRVERSRGDALLDSARWEKAECEAGRDLEDRLAQLKRADERAKVTEARHQAEIKLVQRSRDRYREILNAITEKHPELAGEIATARLSDLGGGVLPGSVEDPDRPGGDSDPVSTGSDPAVVVVPLRHDE